MTMRRCSRPVGLCLAMLGGLLTGLTLVLPEALGWLGWLAPAAALPALLRLTEEGAEKGCLRRAWGVGFLFFFSYYLVTFHWFLVLYPLSFAGFSPATAAVVVGVAWVGLSLFQTVGMAFAFVATVVLWRLPLTRRHLLLRPLIAAAVWTVAEWVQTLGWFGVPWSRLSLGQAAYLPVVQTASLFGCYGITFLLIAVSFSLGQALLTPGAGRRALCLLAGGLFAGNLALGSVLYVVGENRTPTETVVAGTVQGNFSTESKWDITVSQAMQVYRDHIATLTDTEGGVDLILLPETALAFLLEDFSLYMRELSETAVQEEVTLFVGTFTEREETEYSSVVTFHTDGTVDDRLYHKQHLVPFGEFVPMRELVTALIPPLADLNLWESELGAGQGPVVVEDAHGKYGFLICFDSIYETTASDSVLAGAEVLLLPTNDSWFFNSAALRMHNNQARLRAIECGRSVVRAANTGISSLITPTGRVTSSLGAMEEGVVRGEVALYNHSTPYVLFGNWVVLLSAAVALLPVSEKIVCVAMTCLDKKKKI